MLNYELEVSRLPADGWWQSPKTIANQSAAGARISLLPTMMTTRRWEAQSKSLVSISALNWAVYFADYLRYALPFGEGPYPTLTDLNVSYKRSDLDEIKDLWNNEFHEPEIHGALKQRRISRCGYHQISSSAKEGPLPGNLR